MKTSIRLSVVLVALLSRVALGQTGGELLNHSFTVDLATARICLDGAQFTGQPTQASSLNLSMLSQIFDSTNTTVLATGTSHTFTSVGEQFTFQVPYAIGTVSIGEVVGVSASDIPGTTNGAQGFIGSATVADCRLFSAAPVLSTTGLTLTVLVLLGAGLMTLRHSRQS